MEEEEEREESEERRMVIFWSARRRREDDPEKRIFWIVISIFPISLKKGSDMSNVVCKASDSLKSQSNV